MEYNTTRDDLKLREYGRNIHKLIKHIKSIEDKEKRTASAETMVELMKLINPSMKDSPEYAQKLWDDLYIMADFDIDIDSPFPMPEPGFDKKPQRLSYPTYDTRFKHYGKNIELLIEEAIKKEDPEEKKAATIYIGKLMKAFYGSWNKENIDPSIILKNIEDLSKGKLSLDLEEVRANELFEGAKMQNTRDQNPRNSGGGRRKPNRKNFKKRRN